MTSPGGVTEAAEINEVEDGLYAVHFVPKELGVHTVSVKYKDIHIPGENSSPKQFGSFLTTLILFRITIPVYSGTIQGPWCAFGESRRPRFGKR